MGGERKRWIDVLLVSAVVVLLAVCAFFVKPWVDADSVALISPAHALAAVDTKTSLLDRCGSCAEGTLRKVGLNPGVAWIKKDPSNNLLVVAFDSRTVKPDSITAQLAASGYRCNLAGVMGIRQYCEGKCRMAGRSENHSCGPQCRPSAHKGEH